MAEKSFEMLRLFELRLLRCSLTTPLPPPPPPLSTAEEPIKENTLNQLIEDVVSSIENGNYIQTLSSDAVRLIFDFADTWNFEDSIDCAERFYSQVEKSVESFLSSCSVKEEEEEAQNDDDSNWSSKAFLLMCIGVAAFMAFTQNNVTGPSENFPSFPLPFPRLNGEDKAVSNRMEWDMWARNQLISAGSELLVKFSILEYIVYAKILLMKTKDMLLERKDCCLTGTRTISWWLSRLFLLQQRMLDGKSSSLFNLMQVLMRETLDNFGTVENVTRYWGTTELKEGEASTIITMAHLHAGMIEYTYGRTDPCRKYFTFAEEAAGLQLSVTGILGFRRVHQVEAKAQMVLVANTNMSKNGDTCPTIRPGLPKNVCSFGEDPRSSEAYGASDILMTPKLSENGMDCGIDANDNETGMTARTPLGPIQQAVILAKCLLIEKNTPYGELQRWEMAPYIEAVDAQQFSYYIIQCSCDILRIRWESTRNRTKERAVMMMGKLVHGVREASPGAAERIPFSHDVCIHTISALRKEYGELLLHWNITPEAQKIFEDLELWHHVIDCYSRSGKKAPAVELINTQLNKMPNDSRLWCSLGYFTNDDSHYEKALEVSNNQSTQAMRSLAESANKRGDYEASKTHWESAMALNSLYPDGWSELGDAALKAGDTEKALDGFTRAVQLDPDNGLAWTKLALLHMNNKKKKEAFIAFKEAVKYRRKSWELWKAYSRVAFITGNFRQALEATKMVLEVTMDALPKNEHIDAELLETLIMEMEARTSKHTMFPVANGDPNCTIQTHSDDCFRESVKESEQKECGMKVSRENEYLLELLGNVLKQIDGRYDGENIWGLLARWHKFKGDLTKCSVALQKQVRSYEGAELWKNKDKFKKFASSSLQLLKVYMEIYLSSGSCRELEKAEMHLRTKVVQALSCFSDTDELRDLQDYLVEVNKQLQTTRESQLV